ncbi:MAG: hypothetical protein BroJett022_14180 [Actinomycetes bacterium]|nr:MAG: hypothetical protein BroJett022_14180 [Actinomycetes bacterium]
MRRTLKAPLAALGASWLVLGVWVAEAQAQGRGGGRVERLGEKTADLFAGILGPVIIVLVAIAGLYAFMKREIGVAVTAAAIAVFLGLFVFAPETAESLIKGFWQRIA